MKSRSMERKHGSAGRLPVRETQAFSGVELAAVLGAQELLALVGLPSLAKEGGHGIQARSVNHDQFSVSGAVFERQFPARTAGVMRLLRLLIMLLLALPVVLHAQFLHTTNEGTITITGYTGPGGEVVIPGTINGLPVTRIGSSAFALNTSLTNITIPDSVTNIGRAAFEGCKGLSTIAIPDSVASIGEFAFSLCPSLVSFTIPGSVTTIAPGTFRYCSNLTAVTIPSSVTSIGPVAFNACSSLTNITIPNSVTSIGSFAFFFCTNLTSVTIPNSVFSIGASAFDFCLHLREIYFQGNAPIIGSSLDGARYATVYYLPGTTGWGPTFGGLPAVLWNPLMDTSDASFGVLTNRFGFTITGSSNLVLVVEATTDLANPAWMAVGTNTLTDGSSYFSDPHWTNHPARFYRLRSP